MAYDPQPTVRAVKLPEADQHSLSVNEQLDQVFAAQAATVHLLCEIHAALLGKAAPIYEADQIIGEFLSASNNFVNITNK